MKSKNPSYWWSRGASNCDALGARLKGHPLVLRPIRSAHSHYKSCLAGIYRSSAYQSTSVIPHIEMSLSTKEETAKPSPPNKSGSASSRKPRNRRAINQSSTTPSMQDNSYGSISCPLLQEIFSGRQTGFLSQVAVAD